MANNPVITKDLGLVTAYGYAKAGGYQGTEAQFETDFAALMRGQYTALANKPSINGVTLTGNKTASDLGLSAVTNYGDLQGLPQINGVTINGNKSASDLSLQEQLTAGANITIQNGVISASGGGTSDYSALSNKPSINNVSLSGNKSLADLGIQAALTAGTNISIVNNVISSTGGGSGLVPELVTNSTSDFTSGTLGDKTCYVTSAYAYRLGRVTFLAVECGNFSGYATITNAVGVIGEITNTHDGKLRPYLDETVVGIVQGCDHDTGKPLGLPSKVIGYNSSRLGILPSNVPQATEYHIQGGLTNSIYAYYVFINSYEGGD